MSGDAWGDLGGGLPIDDGPELHRCTGGWAGEDRNGRPVPCLTCRPHLRRELDPRTGVTAWRPRRRTEDR